MQNLCLCGIAESVLCMASHSMRFTFKILCYKLSSSDTPLSCRTNELSVDFFSRVVFSRVGYSNSPLAYRKGQGAPAYVVRIPGNVPLVYRT
jgi:hypothetical protein